MKTILIYLFSFISISVIAQNDSTDINFCEQSKTESLVSIRPGIIGKQPFWNEKAVMFKHAPSFQNDNTSWIIPKPGYYRYTAFSFANKQEYTFKADTPYESLAPIWRELPNGEVYLKVEAISLDEKDSYLAGSRMFYKTAFFCPPYPAAKYGYKDAFVKGLHFMYNQPHIQYWLKTGKPDHESHKLYCYSALEVGSVVNAMVLYNKFFPQNDTSVLIACKAADYIIDNAEPAGAPLEFFPKVYEGTDMFAGNYKGEVIMTEPASTGMSFLDLYARTGQKKYLLAATRIADTYLKTQLLSGTWDIRIYKETGKPASEEMCIPINIVNFLLEFTGKCKDNKYQKSVDVALNWIWQNPMKTFNWTGQFEDVAAHKPYQNLSKYEASWFAQYLLNNSDKHSDYIPLAKELIAFCEDQFVVWEKPGINDNWGNSSERWHTPAVLEQFMCYVPIDASAVQMINTFYLAYEKTNEPIYREKALALANSLVNTQLEDGMIPTFWVPGFEEFWNNCMVSSLTMLKKLHDIQGAKQLNIKN
jgi:maltose/maltodextrin transport system substrate-binding protein